MFAFVSLVIGNLALIFSNRSRTRFIFQSWNARNGALWWVSGGAVFCLALVLAVPAQRDIFQFAPLHRWEQVLLALGGLASLFFAESVKLGALRKAIRPRDA